MCIRDRFIEFVKDLREGERCLGVDISNLSMPNHRFVAMNKRLGRSVSCILAILRVAEHLRISRATAKEGKVMAEFLETFSEEQLLMMALMADATDETYTLTNFFDDDEADTALSAEEVGAFLAHGDLLFEREQCLHLDGFTAFAMKILSTSRVLNTKKACPNLRRGGVC